MQATAASPAHSACRFASKSAAIAIYTLAGFSLLGTVGVDTKPLVAGLGVGGFTVGFALRVGISFCVSVVYDPMLLLCTHLIVALQQLYCKYFSRIETNAFCCCTSKILLVNY